MSLYVEELILVETVFAVLSHDFGGLVEYLLEYAFGYWVSVEEVDVFIYNHETLKNIPLYLEELRELEHALLDGVGGEFHVG